MDKKTARLRRSRRARIKIRELETCRLCIHRTPRHIYAQVIGPKGDHILAAASTVEKPLREDIKGNSYAAKANYEKFLALPPHKSYKQPIINEFVRYRLNTLK